MSSRIITLIFVLAVMIPFFFSNWGLTESSEARYAEISWEMFINGDYLHPKLLGINHYHKPPVTYYLTALGYFIFGINEYGVRFFPAMALLFQLFFVYKIADLMFRKRQLSLIAVLIYFSFPIVQVAAKNLTTDCFLTTFIFASIFFYLKYRRQPNDVHYIYLFYIFCGLAFLTKGPVGVLPPAVFAIWHTRVLKIKSHFTIHHFIAILLGIMISFSWFLVLLYNNEKFMEYFLNYHLVQRVSGESFERSKPFWYYIIAMPLLGLPAFYLLVDYLRSSMNKGIPGNSINKIFVITLVICVVVFSLSSSKLVLYILPLYLFIALLSAWHLSVVPEKKSILFKNIAFFFWLIFFIGLIIAARTTTSYVFPALTVSLSILGITCVWVCRFQKITPSYIVAALVSAVGMFILTFIMPGLMKANELEVNSVKPLAIFINGKLHTDSAGIIVYDQLLPSLAFYTNKNIITLQNNNSKIIRETQFEEDDKWKHSYLRISEDQNMPRIRELNGLKEYCIIAKTNNPLPDSLSFLKKKLLYRETFGKWIIYY